MSGEQAPALEQARAILDARRELYGDADPSTLRAMAELALVLRDRGEYREAESFLRESIAIQNRSGLGGKVGLVHTEFNLAIVLDRLGENDAARRQWEDVLAASDRHNGPGSDLSVRAAINLAISLRKLGRYGDEFHSGCASSSRRHAPRGPSTPTPTSPRWWTWRRRIATSETTSWPSPCSPRLWPVWSPQRARTRGRSSTRSGPSRRSWWPSSVPKEASKMFDEVVTGAVRHLEPDDPLRRRAVRQRRAYRLLGRFSRQKPKGSRLVLVD